MSKFNAASKPTDEYRHESLTVYGSSRPSVGSDGESVFLGLYSNTKKAPSKEPERLRQYGTRTTTTAEELQRKQQLAADRKKKHDENKGLKARKVSQEALNFDKKVQDRLNNEQQRQKWFDSAFKK